MTRHFSVSTRALRWVAIVLPVLFMGGVLLVRSLLFQDERNLLADLFVLAVIGIGATFFSFWIFGIVDEREAEIQRRSEQLAGLHAAALALTTELDVGAVLQKVVDLSRDLVGARYGALGVLDADGKAIDQFITSGLTPEERARIGAPPRGHGLLGVVIREGAPLRVPDIGRDPRAVGFPPYHPPMRSLLAVPVKSKGRVIGNLYVSDKVDRDGSIVPFTLQDQQVLEMFSTQAAIAIENAQLYRQKQQLAILQERERFGMDLHDGIIQSIYAIGLMLEDVELRLKTEPSAAERVRHAIAGLNDVIRDIRNYILDLRPQRFQGRDLVRGLEELARELRANTFLTVNLTTDSLEADLLTPEQTVEILHVAQEALTNVRKHARATTVDIDLARDARTLSLIIEDNGVGISPAALDGQGGNGIGNMRERARAAGGVISIGPGETGGTRVALHIPIPEQAHN